SLRQDPYVLAYRYKDYMEEHPMQRHLSGHEYSNKYFENLLANQPEPDADAVDDRSRAVRYAKERYECYYEIRDIERIIGWLNEAEEKPVA
ncbi:hypothetical protein C7974DRAFT_295863, partial [Boeremia exigua]|uniref:uncharacterized protein n=1 Tax=Boeremia exigua TaxID=749465 RepID=UPI001E8DBB12